MSSSEETSQLGAGLLQGDGSEEPWKKVEV